MKRNIKHSLTLCKLMYTSFYVLAVTIKCHLNLNYTLLSIKQVPNQASNMIINNQLISSGISHG